MKNFLHTIESCILCIRYPFLYTRNRFNGRHYNNYKLEGYLYGWREPGHFDKEKNQYVPGEKHSGLYDKAFIEFESYIRVGLYIIWYYIVRAAYEVIRVFHAIPTYTEWDAMPTGWRKAFGKQLLKELKAQLKKDKMLYAWRIEQIKEKWGELCLYCNFGSDGLYNIIEKYEALSYHTCIVCGKPATRLSHGWISPYCDECGKDLHSYDTIGEDGKWHNSEWETITKEEFLNDFKLD